MNTHTAIKLMALIIYGVILFHLCILIKLIPYNIAWGGNLKTDQEMYVFESISIAVNLVLLLVICIKGNYIRVTVHPKIINTMLWLFLILFILNTLGNVLAQTTFEKCFAVLTLISAILLSIILFNKSDSKTILKHQ